MFLLNSVFIEKTFTEDEQVLGCSSSLVLYGQVPRKQSLALFSADTHEEMQALVHKMPDNIASQQYLSHELKALLVDSGLFSSRLFSHVINQVLINERKLYSVSDREKFLSQFYVQSASFKSNFSLHVIGQVLSILENIDRQSSQKLNSIAISEEFQITHEQFQNMLRIWRLYVKDDPRLDALQRALLLSLEYAPEKYIQDIKNFHRPFSGYARKSGLFVKGPVYYNFYGFNFIPNTFPALGIKERAFSGAYDITSEIVFHTIFANSYSESLAIDVNLEFFNLMPYAVEFVFLRNVEAFNLESLIKIRNNFNNQFHEKTKEILKSKIEELNAKREKLIEVIEKLQALDKIAKDVQNASHQELEQRKTLKTKLEQMETKATEIFSAEANPLTNEAKKLLAENKEVNSSFAYSQPTHIKGLDEFLQTRDLTLEDPEDVISMTEFLINNAYDYKRSKDYYASTSSMGVIWFRKLFRHVPLSQVQALYVIDLMRLRFYSIEADMELASKKVAELLHPGDWGLRIGSEELEQFKKSKLEKVKRAELARAEEIKRLREQLKSVDQKIIKFEKFLALMKSFQAKIINSIELTRMQETPAVISNAHYLLDASGYSSSYLNTGTKVLLLESQSLRSIGVYNDASKVRVVGTDIVGYAISGYVKKIAKDSMKNGFTDKSTLTDYWLRSDMEVFPKEYDDLLSLSKELGVLN